MNWKASLDKYLTSPPDDGFDGWYDKLTFKISDPFYEQNEAWVNESRGLFNKWANKLFKRGKSPIQAAQITERAFRIYLK